jgi:hypothetical protein
MGEALALVCFIQQIIGQKQDCQKRFKSRDEQHNKIAGHGSGDLFPVKVSYRTLFRLFRAAMWPYFICSGGC